jgi:hypothetical protein
MKSILMVRIFLDGIAFLESLALKHDNDNAIVHRKVIAVDVTCGRQIHPTRSFMLI